MTERTTPCSRCGLTITYPELYCSNCGAAAPSPPPSTKTRPAASKLKLDEPASAEVVSPPAESAGAASAPEPARVALPPEPAERRGISLDWDDAFVSKVKEAAAREGLAFEAFVLATVQKAAMRTLAKPVGLMSLDDASSTLGIPRSETVQLITAGKLRARKVDGEWKISSESMGPLPPGRGNQTEQIEQELAKLVKSAGLQGVDTSGDAPASATATLCYVNQEALLVCPQSAWRKLGRNRIVAEATDAVRRYKRRLDRDLGRI